MPGLYPRPLLDKIDARFLISFPDGSVMQPGLNSFHWAQELPGESLKMQILCAPPELLNEDKTKNLHFQQALQVIPHFK